MRIDIKEYLEEKLLKDSAAMNMSPTQYIHYLIEHHEVAKSDKILLQPMPAPPVRVQRVGFVYQWKKR